MFFYPAERVSLSGEDAVCITQNYDKVWQIGDYYYLLVHPQGWEPERNTASKTGDSRETQFCLFEGEKSKW